jgi:hypothetical protein
MFEYTYRAFFGRFLPVSEFHLGIFDVLTLCIPFFISGLTFEFYVRAKNSNDFSSALTYTLLLIPFVPITAAFLLARFAFALAMTAVLSPIILIVKCISSLCQLAKSTLDELEKQMRSAADDREEQTQEAGAVVSFAPGKKALEVLREDNVREDIRREYNSSSYGAENLTLSNAQHSTLLGQQSRGTAESKEAAKNSRAKKRT